MSFLKITEPKKRDLIVAEFLKTKTNIQRNQLAERLGEQDATQLAKYMGPIWVADVSKWAGHVGPTWAAQITPTFYV